MQMLLLWTAAWCQRTTTSYGESDSQFRLQHSTVNQCCRACFSRSRRSVTFCAIVAKIAHSSPASRSRSSVPSDRSSWARRTFARHIFDSRASRSVSLILCRKSALLPASSASVRLLETESAARTSCRQTVSLGMLVKRRGHATLTPVLNVSARRCNASVLARAGVGFVMGAFVANAAPTALASKSCCWAVASRSNCSTRQPNPEQ